MLLAKDFLLLVQDRVEHGPLDVHLDFAAGGVDEGVQTAPGLVRVNFYGDGKPTWALVLIAGENPKRKAELVVARQVGESWEIRSLETTDGTPVVWREGPGKYSHVYGKKTIRAAYPVIIFCGYESWAILYAWTGKEVKKVWISD